MPRQKNDGRGRMGGRQKGTPNKHVPIKQFLAQHSVEYFTPNIHHLDEDGNPTGKLVSQYDIDIMDMRAADRVNAELSLLKFHTPQMQATSVDMTLQDEHNTLSERLSRLSAGEEIESTDE